MIERVGWGRGGGLNISKKVGGGGEVLRVGIDDIRCQWIVS